MPDVSASFTLNSLDITAWSKQANQAASSGRFSASLANADSLADARELAGTFIENIMRALDNTLTKQNSAAANSFPFTAAFETTFGTSGPLLDFINVTTSRLNLSAKQNQALQDIAVKNKDITYTPANIQKIAGELKQAGIA